MLALPAGMLGPAPHGPRVGRPLPPASKPAWKEQFSLLLLLLLFPAASPGGYVLTAAAAALPCCSFGWYTVVCLLVQMRFCRQVRR